MAQNQPDFLKLSIAERIRRIEAIWDSVLAENPDSIGVSQAQRAELQRRVDAYESGESEARAWQQVLSRLQSPRLAGA